jgi:hypothetical protein
VRNEDVYEETRRRGISCKKYKDGTVTGFVTS